MSNNVRGYITLDQFFEHSLKFLEVSNILNDGWNLRNVEGCHRGLYLTKKQIIVKETLKSRVESDPQEVSNNIVFVSFDYHIVYSDSYSTPILYFNAMNSDGSKLKVEEIWDLLSLSNENGLLTLDEKYKIYGKMITQMEHPILGKPYFAFHPCKTSEFMSELMQNSKDTQSENVATKTNYIWIWLSRIGPFVGLSPGLNYAKYF
ncbi:ubiquitin-like-conjugating enzyme ATG10 isoform X4 [Dinothrombium tinctorium]|uniref:Ubiquitin-like-conjugating enzyme ATG10 n=1 Tax=Dinothrombium tinctorium TaxID=1965070 RepID=A0A443RB93_9ACAR|nr:ubiquitin-like-conjugating enzyme ATG10 isoform X4 [Dinothrombium tinctorium]RWS12520.1 ubiquitin-like-conjugating enzyme ATG10 isoform X4 [Dinothrombium tinctorium]